MEGERKVDAGKADLRTLGLIDAKLEAWIHGRALRWADTFARKLSGKVARRAARQMRANEKQRAAHERKAARVAKKLANAKRYERSYKGTLDLGLPLDFLAKRIVRLLAKQATTARRRQPRSMETLEELTRRVVVLVSRSPHGLTHAEIRAGMNNIKSHALKTPLQHAMEAGLVARVRRTPRPITGNTQRGRGYIFTVVSSRPTKEPPTPLPKLRPDEGVLRTPTGGVVLRRRPARKREST